MQPSYRLVGMKITMEFPKPKADEEVPAEQEERKQVPLLSKASLMPTSAGRHV